MLNESFFGLYMCIIEKVTGPSVFSTLHVGGKVAKCMPNRKFSVHIVTLQFSAFIADIADTKKIHYRA